ncbi:MAG TPA: hypothetical protein VGF84_03900, partial [Micromonosporaceae bacterium]
MPVVATGNTLLTYALIPNPDPLQVNGPGILILTVSNSTDRLITASEIVVTVPGGVNAKDLTTQAGTIETQPLDGWTVSNGAGAITLTPSAPANIGRDGVVFVFDNFAVNGEPGTTTLTIVETASSSGMPAAPRTASLALAKFPAQFSLSDLTTDDLDVPYGGSATLTWAGTAGATYTLEYQPADSGPPVNAPVGNAGTYTANQLTRSDSVTFTLTASVTVPGQDQPLIAQRQHTVTIETVTLSTTFEPPTVGMGGLVRFTWDAPNADGCTLEDGTQLPASGTCYLVMQSTRQFTVTAMVGGNAVKQLQSTIKVDPAIVPTEAGVAVTAGDGSPGDVWTCVAPGTGRAATCTGAMAPLDLAVPPARVIPITLVGGRGGSVHHAGKLRPPCRYQGGAGGDAVIDITLDAAEAPAQYVIAMRRGAGGQGVLGPGASGAIAITIDGQPGTISPPQLASGRKTKKGGRMTIGATGETLLTYAMSTDPDPLQVGGPGILTLAVSNSTNALITCNQIVVTFPGGVNAKDLTTDAGSIETQHPDAWRASNSAGQITLTPTDGGQIGRDGVVFVFDNFAVNSEPG